MKKLLIIVALALVSPGLYDIGKAVNRRALADAKANNESPAGHAAAAETARLSAAAALRSEESARYHSAKRLIESQLKAPGTAEFSTYAPGKTTTGAKLLTKGRWLASGTVDAQNSFGAKLRQQWFVLTNADESVLFVALGDQTSGRIPDDIKSPDPAPQAAQPPPPAATPGRTWTYVPGLGRYIEHDSSVSAMRSIGGG